jgi:hypothetical protein
MYVAAWLWNACRSRPGNQLFLNERNQITGLRKSVHDLHGIKRVRLPVIWSAFPRSLLNNPQHSFHLKSLLKNETELRFPDENYASKFLPVESEGFSRHSESLLGSTTLWKLDLFPSSGEGTETPTLLGSLERNNRNRWTTDSMMGKVQKPSNSETLTTLSLTAYLVFEGSWVLICRRRYKGWGFVCPQFVQTRFQTLPQITFPRCFELIIQYFIIILFLLLTYNW